MVGLFRGKPLYLPHVMSALTFCCCVLALAVGVSTAATPEGHNPLRMGVAVLTSQR